MDDPAAEFLARERQELGALSDELNLQNYNESSENGNQYIGESEVHMSASIEENKSIIEPEKIKKWREDFKNRLELKDKFELEKINELEMIANKELHSWSCRYREQLAISVKNNKEENTRIIRDQKKMNETINTGNSLIDKEVWDNICKLCNFKQNANPTTGVTQSGVKEVTRMKEVLVSLRHVPLIR